MKRASYNYGVRWIARNDDVTEMDPHTISYQISSLLLADLFDVDPERVGVDVLRYRTKHGNE